MIVEYVLHGGSDRSVSSNNQVRLEVKSSPGQSLPAAFRASCTR
jgi:hypothetical protein